ncbi:MAG: ABC transporter permease [Phycisphaerae bacterium]
MSRRILWRLVQTPLILWSVYTITFLMVVTVPGNPFEHEGGRRLPKLIQIALRQRYGMENNWAFYWRYLGRAVRGDLGVSLHYKDWTCNQIIAHSLPVSAALGTAAMAIALAAGVALGLIGAVRRHSLWDYASLAVAVIGLCVPNFVIGAALLILLCVMVRLFPAGGWGTPAHLVLPAVTLSLPFMAYIARLTRLGMLEVLGSDFVRTARAKGLAESQVLLKHALRVAFLPVLSFLGPAAAAILTGSFVVEKVFNIPGLGLHFVNSVINRDQMLILAAVTVYSTLIVAFNLLVDLAYVWLDPRISAEAV